MTARVVVTGSEGFVGRHLRAALVARGVEVVGIGRPGSGAEVEVDLGARSIVVDEVVRSIGAVDGVIWLAATISRGSSVGPEARENLEVIATRAAEWMEATHAVAPAAHFVFCSSLKLYGPSRTTIDPERPPLAPDPWSYGCAKALAERLLAVASARCGATWCTVRPSYVYGPGQHVHNAIPRFLAACWRGEAPVVFGEGDEVRDDVLVTDVATVLAEAWARRATGAFHAASGQAMTLREVAEACCRAVESLGGPPGIAPVHDRTRPATWWLDRTFDVSRTEVALGVRPTPLAEGLRREAAWIRDGVAGTGTGSGTGTGAAIGTGTGTGTGTRTGTGTGTGTGPGPDVAGASLPLDIVVTGATGRVGRRVVSDLRAAGHRVVALTRRDADLTRDDAVAAITPHLGPDVVLVHLAAMHPSDPSATTAGDRRALIDVNVHGTLRVLQACRDAAAARVVFASTSSGRDVGAAGSAVSDLAATKLAGEDHLRVLGEEAEIAWCVLRLPRRPPTDDAEERIHLERAASWVVSAVTSGLQGVIVLP